MFSKKNDAKKIMKNKCNDDLFKISGKIKNGWLIFYKWKKTQIDNWYKKHKYKMNGRSWEKNIMKI